jgi:hypothetical protein
MGFDTFEGAEYPLSEHDGEEDAREAARERLRMLEETQPSSVSGGQGHGGIQDRVFIIAPDGTRTRFTATEGTTTVTKPTIIEPTTSTLDNVTDLLNFKEKKREKAVSLGREHGKQHVDDIVAKIGLEQLCTEYKALGMSETVIGLCLVGANLAEETGAMKEMCLAYGDGFADAGLRRVEELTGIIPEGVVVIEEDAFDDEDNYEE